jgi:hypothetical protein
MECQSQYKDLAFIKFYFETLKENYRSIDERLILAQIL